MTAQQSEAPDRCVDGRMHFKKRINGEWVCMKCTHYCTSDCGRQVAVAGARCIRCANTR